MISVAWINCPGQHLNVTQYRATLKPSLNERSIEGSVEIVFESNTDTLQFDAASLLIDSVAGSNIIYFSKEGTHLTIVRKKVLEKDSLIIYYHGKPSRGLIFNSNNESAHTLFFTSSWMVCNDTPSDKAKIELTIYTPIHKDCIASGELTKKITKAHEIIHRWNQSYETPTYSFGFAIGSFNQVEISAGKHTFKYYSAIRGQDELLEIFKETRDILAFMEHKSGIPYVQTTYSQLFLGNNYQEMSGFALFKESYGDAVLKDSSEIHLTSHELAHQWWGNMITCKSFNHFWLNEAFAVYMASAFHEVRFGKEKYLSDIQLYKKIYEDLKQKGKDKPLVFEKWEATRDNRGIAYYKGAYVLHLLRQKLGDEIFWRGIRHYSQRHFGGYVETIDFQRAMQEVSGLDLHSFFQEWVYSVD